MTPALPIRVLVADDHPAIRVGMAAVLSQETDIELVGEAENGARALALYREHQPHVVLMDLRMPVMDGVQSIQAIRKEFPDARILALTTFDGDADIRRALDAGASGYMLKDMLLIDVINAVRAVYRGEQVIPANIAARLAAYQEIENLSPRESEILTLVAQGLSNKDVARAIGRTSETVKIHLKSIFVKLGVTRRTEAVTTALARGLIRLG